MQHLPAHLDGTCWAGELSELRTTPCEVAQFREAARRESVARTVSAGSEVEDDDRKLSIMWWSVPTFGLWVALIAWALS